MRVLYPAFALGSLSVVSLRTVPLLKSAPELRAGDRSFPVEEGPPFELAGLQVWHKAEELAGLGRELIVELAFPGGDGSYLELAPILADERHARAPLKLLSRFRPPLEGEGPAVLLGAVLTEAGHAPMELSDDQKDQLAAWLETVPAVGLFPAPDAEFFRTRAPSRPSRRKRRSGGEPSPASAGGDGQGPGPLSGWRAAAALKERGRVPYPLERSVLDLPGESWMKRTAELFGMLPLKWTASGGFFQGSPSSSSWGDVLRAAAPSLDIMGSADGLFPVPVLSGSLLDNAVGAHRAEVFVGEGRPVPSRHVMICGPTGTGKTLLGTFAMLNECAERGFPAVYLGPTRMLVEDAALEFLRLLAAVEREAARPGAVDRGDVLVSTGESFYDDGRIAAGDFKAAFIVYEKAGNFFLNADLTGRLGFVLIDELHMLGDRIRGGALDVTLARLVAESRTRIRTGGDPLRIMCLSTGAMAGDRCLLEMMSPPGRESFPDPCHFSGPSAPPSRFPPSASFPCPAAARPGDPSGPGRGSVTGGRAVMDGPPAASAGGDAGAGVPFPADGGSPGEPGFRSAFLPLAAIPAPDGIHLAQDIGTEDPDAPDVREALGQSPSADPAERLSPGFLHNPGAAAPYLLAKKPFGAGAGGAPQPPPAPVLPQQGPSHAGAGGAAAGGGGVPSPTPVSSGAGAPSGPEPAAHASFAGIPVPGVLAGYPGLRLPGPSEAAFPGPPGGGGAGGRTLRPGEAGGFPASRADSVYEAARRPDFIAPAGWGPLVLSVFERPQRLLTYIQPTSPSARCRPFHVGRIADSQLTPDDFVLDRVAGSRFISSLDGWMPGHEKIIYASYSGVSLTAFARRAVDDFGRGRVPGIVDDGFYLRELEASLARTGAREQSKRFYLEAASRGVFFHFSGLSRETRRLMADGYRRFSPLPGEPFILCATETISYGVNLPADALFLENISWPRSRYRHCYSIEALTSNEFRNLVGRVGRYGHIKPGVIPTVVVNWPLGRSVSSPPVFEGRRRILAEIASSSPASEIDCRDLQGHLMKPAAGRLSDCPGPVGRFYLLALLHASRAAGGAPVTAAEAAAFLSETYTVRSLNRHSGGGPPDGLLSGLAGFLDNLAREFGSLVAESGRSGAGRTYRPGSLCLNLARNDTSPCTLKELDGLLECLGGGPETLAPGLFGLRTMLAVPLLTEMRHVFTRVFADPRMLSRGALRKARTDPGEAERWFRRASAPAAALLVGTGMTPEASLALCGSVRRSGRAIVERHLRENFRRASRSLEVTAFLRDAFLQKVLSTVRTLLMWIDGRTVKSILSVAGSGLLAASPGSPVEGEGDGGGNGDAHVGNVGPAGPVPDCPRDGFHGASVPEPDVGRTGEARDAAAAGARFRGFPPEGLALPGDGSPPEDPEVPEDPDEAGAAEGDTGPDRDPDAEPGADGRTARELASARWQETPPKRLKGGVDTHSFNQRYCDKTALVMDSYLAYRLAAGAVSPEEAASLQAMCERVRWGLRSEDLDPFNRDRKERGLSREEWLARSGSRGAAGDGGP
jgi:hypothetical protein